MRLDPETRRRLDEESRRIGQPADRVTERAIVRYLESQDAFRQLCDAAVAEADRGAFISESAMHRRIESWDADREVPVPEPDVFPPEQD